MITPAAHFAAYASSTVPAMFSVLIMTGLLLGMNTALNAMLVYHYALLGLSASRTLIHEKLEVIGFKLSAAVGAAVV